MPPGELESLVDSVVRREELGTTGIGLGVAIPHTKHPAVRRVVGAFACAPTGIDFASVDGRPVHLIFLLLSPVGESRSHLLALEAISRRISHCGYQQWRNPCRHGED